MLKKERSEGPDIFCRTPGSCRWFGAIGPAPDRGWSNVSISGVYTLFVENACILRFPAKAGNHETDLLERDLGRKRLAQGL